MKGVGFGLGEGRFCKGWRLEVGEGGGGGDGGWGRDRGGLKRYVDDGRDYLGIAIKTPTSSLSITKSTSSPRTSPTNSIASTKPQERDAGNNSSRGQGRKVACFAN